MAAPVSSSDADSTQNADAWIDSVRGALSPVTLTRLGPFELVRELGRGGQAVIYLARDSRTGQTIALKRLHARAASSTLCQARLLREAACLQRLSHPFIVTCRGVTWVDDEPLLLMDGVDGLPVGEWARVQMLSAPDSARSPIVAMAVQICDAVAHAHDRGVLHLDLKPSNIRIVRDADGAFTPRLLDFGLAMSTLAGEASDDLLAWSGGTSGYLAPELRADPKRRPDVRCDTFGLGVLLNDLLQSAAVSSGEGMMSGPHLGGHPNRRSPLSSQLSSLIRRATQPDPDLRYQSASALADDLRSLLAARRLKLPRVPIRDRWRMLHMQGRWARRGVAALIVGCIYLLVSRGIPRGTQSPPSGDADLAAAQLITELVQEAGSDRAGPRAATIDSLPALARLAETKLSNQPRAAAEVLHAVGGAYRSLWHWTEAEPLLEKSVGLFAAMKQFNDPAAIDARAQYGRVLTSKRDPRAVEILREVVATRQRVHGADDPRTIYARVSLAYALHRAAVPPEWDEAIFNGALADYARIHGERHRDIASCLHNFGYMRLRQQRFADADELYGRALTMFDGLGDFDDPWRLECMHGYSSLLITRERFDAAAKVLADAIPRVRTRFGDSGVLNLLWRAGYVHAQLGDTGAMQTSFKDAFATLVSIEAAAPNECPPEVGTLFAELTECLSDREAPLPIGSIISAWPCLPLRLRHDLTDGLQQYVEALVLMNDPAQADAIRQFIAQSTP